MKTIQGPAVFLAQFYRDQAPFNTLDSLADWAAAKGFVGLQIPTWIGNLIDLDTAAESAGYCQEYSGRLAQKGLAVVDLGSYLQGQCMAFNQAYAPGFSAFHPAGLKGDALTAWAQGELRKSILAARNLGVRNVSVMSGGLLWHMIYPWPQRPDGLVESAFAELAKRWLPILRFAQENGVSIGFELHPGSDLFDGATFSRFLEAVDGIPSAMLTYDPSHFVLQYLDYLRFIELFSDRIAAMQPWLNRAGRFRSLGDGQVDFKRIFSLLTERNFDGWAILEWECCLKSSEQGAAEGAEFIRRHIIQTAEHAFDDFASMKRDENLNRQLLGLEDR